MTRPTSPPGRAVRELLSNAPNNTAAVPTITKADLRQAAVPLIQVVTPTQGRIARSKPEIAAVRPGQVSATHSISNEAAASGMAQTTLRPCDTMTKKDWSLGSPGFIASRGAN